MSERRGPKALELWCRRITEGYPGVNVQNMTTSWRDGLAFCAMIHHFRPDLIDFNSLNKDDVYRNNEKAFRIAEEHLGIPALLDAEDMASCAVPDRLSILTYLSQFYQQFGGSSPSRVAMSRTIETKNQPITPESTPSKVVTRLGMRREPCTVCGMPVFLAEKLVISRTTYHRTCFRCARCQAQLTPGNYYETEEGQYCCETCPDEDVAGEASLEGPCEGSDGGQVEIGHERSLSDEEKCVKQGQVNVFSKETAQISHMRLHFISNHLLDAAVAVDTLENNDDSAISAVNSMTKNTVNSTSENDCVNSVKKNFSDINNSIEKKCCLTATNNFDNNETMQTSSQDTKDTLGIVDKNYFYDKKPSESDQHLSLVQQRLKIFENPSINHYQRVKSMQDTCDQPTTTTTYIEPDSLETSVANEGNPIAAVNVAMMQELAKQVEDSCDAIDVVNVSTNDVSEENPTYPIECNPFDDEISEEKVAPKRESTNPFGSDSEEEEEEVQAAAPVPAARRKIIAGPDESLKRVLVAPKINLNPFWSDDEEPESDEETESVKVTAPVPKPRTKSSEMSPVKPLMRRDDFHMSNSSLASTSSNTTCSSHRKRPAPPPPMSAQSSPIKTTPKPRKSRRAPPPPLGSSTPEHLSLRQLTLEESPSVQTTGEQSWEDVKLSKNATNISRQSMPESDSGYVYQDKSVEGKWKRKKAPAPARPTPQRRRIKVMSMRDVTAELGEIELQQQGLEKQGVRLEHLIREKCERGDNNESSSLTNDADELVLDLFALVNEKNELFRRQAELMLLKRQQRLEEEHADVEYQIRCLMCQPEATKTDFDKQREESLIQRLVDIVERRSEIVECLEMDRRREIEEDRSINMHMEMYTAKKADRSGSDASSSISSQKGKKKLKEKAKNLIKSHKKDADKDVDESEVKLKRASKKKWF